MTSKAKLEAQIESLTDDWLQGLYTENSLMALVEELTDAYAGLMEQCSEVEAELEDADAAISIFQELTEVVGTAYDQLSEQYHEMYEAGLAQADKLDQLTNDYNDLAMSVIHSFKA